MSSMDRFLGKAKKIQLDGQEIDVWPMSFDETDIIIKLGDKDPNMRASATKELLRKSLKKSFPDASDAEIEQFNLKFMNDFLNAVFEASGLEVDRKKLESMTAAC